MRWSTAVLLAPAFAGCSFIYNPNNLPDPRMIDAAVVDANPCALTITSIAPTIIKEGQGDSSSPPALLVIHGDNIVNTNLKVDLKSHDGSTVQLTPITDAVASADHTYLAFTVTAHVDQALTTDVALDVTVTQDAPQDGSCMGKATEPLSGKLTLHGLPELTTLTTTLLSEYSMVALSNVTFPSSANPVVINAVSSIKLGTVVADATGAMPGPGGYMGLGTSGGGPGGGGVGTGAAVAGTGGGGGGAGFAADGTAGQGGGTGGGTGGAAGHRAGDALLALSDENRPSAGGGGGAGLIAGLSSGGPGGGGGGIVFLIAGGNIMTGTVSANGGKGSPAGGAGGGGGGGGAGGTVLVSTASGTLSTGAITVNPGAGGQPGGGAGSVGRVRWDAPANPASSPNPVGHRGPAFATSTRVFTTQPPSLTLAGTSNDGFTYRVIDQGNTSHDGGHASFNSVGVATITPALHAGYNQVCITLDGGTQGSLQADKCIDVAFLP